MSDPIKIGIIGLGWVATHRHVRAISRDKRFKIIGVADRRRERAEEWGKKLDVEYCAAEAISEISWLDSIDALDVATAPMSHFPLIRDALIHGKHVITEKPFCATLSEGRALVDLATKKERVLAVVHNFQFARSMQKLRADIQLGKVGKIKSVSAVQWGNPKRRLPTWYDKLPMGLFYDESPHLLYLLRALSPGPLNLVSTHAFPSTTGLNTPASIEALYYSAGIDANIPVSLSCKFESPLSEWHVSVLGDRSAGLIDIFRDIYIRLPNDGAHRAIDVVKTSLSASRQHWGQHFTNGPKHLTGNLLYGNDRVFSNFADAVQNRKNPLGIAAQDAIDVLEMQWNIIDSCSAHI